MDISLSHTTPQIRAASLVGLHAVGNWDLIVEEIDFKTGAGGGLPKF